MDRSRAVLRLLVGLLAGLLAALTSAAVLSCGSRPPAPPDTEECTIALISGHATPDGRPILFKNRDDAGHPNDEARCFTDGRYRYVALVDAGVDDRAWAGLNETGFAVLNALSFNLIGDTGTVHLGLLMKWALQSCDSIADFRRLLDDTNWSGRTSPANFAVMDAAGGVSLFEARRRSYVEYRVDDPAETAGGLLVRTNFSFSADTLGSSRTRYHRCNTLVREAAARGALDLPFLFSTVARDLWCRGVDPYPLPYAGAPMGYPSAVGYVDASDAINGRATVASCVIAGVRPGEDPRLATFFVALGQPVVSPHLPVWVAAGPAPLELDGPATSPVCDLARERASNIYDLAASPSLLNTRDLVGGGGPAYLSRVEWVAEWVAAETDAAVARWREAGADSAEMAAVERRIASEAYAALASLPRRDGALLVRIEAGPNPARGSATIAYAFDEPPPEDWRLEIFDVQGRRVAALAPPPGPRLLSGTLLWDGRGDAGRVPSGVYFLRAAGGRTSRAERLVFLR